MTHINKLQNFTNIIEQNIENDINIDDIIKDLYISKFHFYRLFKAIIGVSINEYIKRVRIYYSAKRMMNTKESLLAIAIRYGFSSHELLSRNFKKYIGVTPKFWRKNPNLKKLDNLKPYSIESLLISLENSNGTVLVRDEVVHSPEKLLVGIETVTTDDKPEIILNRINEFLTYVDCITNISEKSVYRITHTINTKSDPIEYKEFIGVPVTDISNIPDGLTSFCLKQGEYLKIEHKGRIFNSSGSIIDTYSYIYRYKIAMSEYQLSMDCNYEVYGEKFISPDSDESITDIYMGLM